MTMIRPARPDDTPTAARIWSDGWRDGHLGQVPDDFVGTGPG